MAKVKLNDFLVADNRAIGELNMYFPYIMIYFKNKEIIEPLLSTEITIEEMQKCGCTLDDLRTKSELFFDEDNLLCLRIRDRAFETGSCSNKNDLENLFKVEFI